MQAMAKERLLSGSVLDRQIETEMQAVQDGVERYKQLVRDAYDRKRAASLKPVERLCAAWFPEVVRAIQKDNSLARAGAPAEQVTLWGPVYLALPPEKVAVIGLNVAMSELLVAPDGLGVTYLSGIIGQSLEGEVAMQAMKRHARKTRKSCLGCEAKRRGDDTVEHSCEDLLAELRRKYKQPGPKQYTWLARKRTVSDVPRRMRVSAGARLLWTLTEVCSMPLRDDEQFRIAFHRRTQQISATKKQAMVALDPEIMTTVDEGHMLRMGMRPRYLPMVVKPYRWETNQDGGYVRIRTPLVAGPTIDQRKAYKSADLTRIYEALSAVSSTAQRINRKRYAVAMEVWKAGGGPCVPGREDYPMPQRLPDGCDPIELRMRKRERVEIYRRNIGLKAERQFFLRKMGIAERFLEDDAIWYPHQMDYRTRCIPIPTHLNHQGDDLCRGLLELAEPVKPGARGMEWIMMHAADCYGIGKASFNQRLEWASQNLKMLERCGEDPLAHDNWRAENVDKPWQFLSACMAIVDPEQASRLQVQVDGTCNGFQHYVALGRDEAGAALVNMMPSTEDDPPKDLYSIVADGVRELVGSDIARGKSLAEKMLPLVQRSLVKQPVMTTVYGVTESGTREQVRARLREAGLKNDALYEATKYLAAATSKAIAKASTGASSLMAWIRKCAGVICGEGKLLTWRTPLGFPVVQPHRRVKAYDVNAAGWILSVNIDKEGIPVFLRRQVNASAPNFIHSIDATHMFMTALACEKQGVSFLAIHDAYRSHAAHMDRLGVILRQQFASLHKRSLIDDLHQQFRKQSEDVPEPPAPGTYDPATVLQSANFFG